MKKSLFALSVLVASLVSCSKNKEIVPVQPDAATVSAGTTGKNTTPGACANIIQFDLKQGKREANPLIWTILMDYTIKPCNTAASLSGTITVVDTNTGETVYTASGLALSGRATFLGVAYGIYRATLSVVDNASGNVIETKVASIKVQWLGV